MNNYLKHHGVLGQKWGVRRFQNSDGTLTAEGKAHYNTGSIAGHIGRAATNTALGQRLIGVGTNRGYRRDKNEIKNLYEEKRSKIKDSSLDKTKKKEKLKNLKNDYKKTLGEARTSAAQALYPWQNKSQNERIQTTHAGMHLINSFLAGGYGALNYNRLRANDTNQFASSATALISGMADTYLRGLVSTTDYAYNAISYGSKHKNKR